MLDLSKIKTVGPEDDHSEMIYSAMRVEDLPKAHVESTKFDCDNCHKKVWVDKRVVKQALKCKAIWCMRCVMNQIQND